MVSGWIDDGRRHPHLPQWQPESDLSRSGSASNTLKDTEGVVVAVAWQWRLESEYRKRREKNEFLANIMLLQACEATSKTHPKMQPERI